MKHGIFGAIFLFLLQATAAQEPQSALFEEADRAMQAAQAAEAELLAPLAFAQGMEHYRGAEADIERGREAERVQDRLRSAVEAFENATEGAEITRVSLAALIKTREDAINAAANTFAPEFWNDAEEIFTSAVRRLESDDFRGARSRAQEGEVLYRDAELTAIKAQYLSQTRALLAEAERARVQRIAPVTLARAQSLLAQAEQELNENRYDTDRPRSLAQQANYEARHAIYLAEQISAMRDLDLTEEHLILTYEEPLTQIAAAADIVARLDAGTDSIVNEMVAFIEDLRDRLEQSELDIEDYRTRVFELEEEIRVLDEQLGGVSQERVALVQRLEAEARIREQFQSIDNMFAREEARVSREGNNILLRLVGLTFPSNESSLDEGYRGLLEKVNRAAAVFPRSSIVIEGHTDSYGSDDDNMTLSRERAEAVREYLISEFGVQQFRITAIGYGETQPIANNETEQGRERNRRIDIRIEPEIESPPG